MRWLLVSLMSTWMGLGVAADHGGEQPEGSRDEPNAPATRPAFDGEGPHSGRSGMMRDGRPGRGRWGGRQDSERGPWWTEGEGGRHGGSKGRGGRYRDVPSEPLTDEQVDAMMKVAEEHFPEMYDRLTSLRGRNPKMFRRMLGRLQGPMADFMQKQEEDPEFVAMMTRLHRVEMELRELHRSYHKESDASRKSDLESKIGALLAERFNLRMAKTRHELDRAEERLKRAREELAKTEKSRETIVADELEKILTTKGPLKPDRPPGLLGQPGPMHAMPPLGPPPEGPRSPGGPGGP